jgi:hypothetical protein
VPADGALPREREESHERGAAAGDPEAAARQRLLAAGFAIQRFDARWVYPYQITRGEQGGRFGSLEAAAELYLG